MEADAVTVLVEADAVTVSFEVTVTVAVLTGTLVVLETDAIVPPLDVFELVVCDLSVDVVTAVGALLALVTVAMPLARVDVAVPLALAGGSVVSDCF